MRPAEPRQEDRSQLCPRTILLAQRLEQPSMNCSEWSKWCCGCGS